MDMEEIPSSTVTRSPALYFERASRGETIMLTRYGRPYVVLSPPPEYMPKAEEEKGKKADRAKGKKAE